MKDAINKIDAVMEYIISLAKKYDANISLDDDPNYDINNKWKEGTGLYTASFGMKNTKFLKRAFSSDSPDNLKKMIEAFDKEANRNKEILFSVTACEILDQLKEAKDDISKGETEKGIIILIDAMRKLLEFRITLNELDYKISGGFGKIKKTKISDVIIEEMKLFIKNEIAILKNSKGGWNHKEIIEKVKDKLYKDFKISIKDRTLKDLFKKSNFR